MLDLTLDQQALLKNYFKEAAVALQKEQAAKDQFKEVVEAVHETMGSDNFSKADISALFKSTFKGNAKEVLEKAENIFELSEKLV